MTNQAPVPVAIAVAPAAAVAGTTFQPVVGEGLSGLLELLATNNIVSRAGTQNVRTEAIRILQQAVPPTQAAARRVGLVCGYVQSGKTVSIESVSALAKDNGYRAVILLAGVTTILLDQSSDRMEEELRAGAGGYDWHMLKNPRLQDRQRLETLLQNWRNLPPGAPSTRMLFVTVMKQHQHLDHLSELLESLAMQGIPALVIDDEADQASLNTRPLQPNPSTTYLCIERLRQALPQHTLLQYTATPQAPLLISRIDSLSADFAELVSPGEGYAGGRSFFHERRDDLVRDIPQNEIFDPNNIPVEAPASLIEAMQVFLVGVASVPRDQQANRNRSMLIHPHQRRGMHAVFYAWITAILQDWYRTLMATNDPDRGPLLAEFELAYNDLIGTRAQLPPFEVISQTLAEAINRVVCTVVNSDNGREILWKNGYGHILVGGEKLGRGYTVKGLTVTYMPRGPGGLNADTIQQRARFFGYHAKPTSGYLDLCRVYLDTQVAQIFTDYVDHEEDLRSQIDRHRGRPLKELKRAFLLDRVMRPTRHNIMQRLYERTRLSANWFEQRAPHAPGGGKNRELVAALRDRLAFQLDPDFNRHAFTEVLLESLLTNFLISFETPDDRDALPMMAILMALADECERAPDTTCRLYLMDRDVPQIRRRTLNENDGDIALMQGRSSATGPGRYPGDRAFCDDSRVTVQIHRLRIERDVGAGNAPQVIEDDVPALAIRLPAAMAARLTDIVVQAQN